MTIFDDLIGMLNVDETKPDPQVETHVDLPDPPLQEQPSNGEGKDARDMYGAQFKTKYAK